MSDGEFWKTKGADPAAVATVSGPGAEEDLSLPVDDREEETSPLSFLAPGGPVVVEVALRPLALRPTLPPTEVIDLHPTQPGFWRRHRLFFFTVFLPMLIGSLYLFVLAAPRFASSATFIVRAVASSSPEQAAAAAAQAVASQQTASAVMAGQQSASSTGQQTQAGGQQSAGQSTGSGGAQSMSQGGQLAGASASTIAQEETYSVNAYLTSRDIVAKLSKNNNLRAILSRPQGDFLFRFPNFWLPDNNEFLYRRFRWMVSAEIDESTMLSTLEVDAFVPQDAKALATTMLEYAEDLVNQMNRRSYEDGLAAAERLVATAQKEFDAAEAALKAYRNASGSIDPEAVSASKLAVIEALSTQLAQIQAMIAQQTEITPTSPNLPPLEAQAAAYRHEIEKRKREIAGSANSEADKLVGYEELTTNADLAAKALAFAVAEKTQAMQDAQRRHLFIQIISRPNLSLDWARYPRVTLDLAALLAVCLISFLVLRKATES